MPINKGSLAGLWSVIIVGVIFVLLSGGGAAAGFSGNQHRGEELYDGPLLGLENVEGRWQLNFGRPRPGLLATDFTMSSCGQELAPTIPNLMSMVGGADCRSWSMTVEDRMMVYHRLEFQCR